MDKPVLNIVFFIMLFTACHSFSQENLVYNGSFEEYSSCPDGNDLGNGQLEKCKGWWKPTFGTSDYFNSCNTTIVSVPSNFWGYQHAYDGNAYVGLVPIEWDTITNQILGLEYIQTKLKHQLRPCTQYHLSFYVSCANKSYYALGKLGAYFGDNIINQQNAEVLNKVPQVRNNFIISDTTDWIKIEGDFIASGKEIYMTIGYFTTDFTNDTLYIQPSFASSVAPYYYIDSVSLVETGPVPECDMVIPNIFTPNNDGVNDAIDFSYLDRFEELRFSILNRWGNIIYNYEKSSPIWDGTTSSGKSCSDGTYFYVFESKTIFKTGFIQLIR